MSKLFALYYNMNEIAGADVAKIAESIQGILDKDDQLLVIPQSFQFHQLSYDDLLDLRQCVEDMISLTYPLAKADGILSNASTD